MARPRTLGPAITFRLPVALHEIVAARAEAHNETVADYVKRYLTRALEHQADRPPTIYDRGKPKGPVEPRWKASMKP